MDTPTISQLIARADAAIALRRWTEAERAARGALAIDPASEAAHAQLSRALSGQSRHAEAIGAAEAGLSSNPSSEWLHRVHSIAYFEAGRHREALQAAYEAVRLSPDAGSAHHLRSIALQGLGRTLEAREAAERAVALAPDAAEFRAQLGNTWLTEGPASAEIHYRASLAISPEQPPVLNNLGVALLRQRKRMEAALAFKSAVLIDPGFPLAKRNLVIASTATIGASPVLNLFGLALTIPAIGLLSASGNRHGQAALVFNLAACALVALQLAVWYWAHRRGLRRLERSDPQLSALRRNLARDLEAGRIPYRSLPVRWFGTALAAFGIATALGCLVGEVFVVERYLAFPSQPRVVTAETAKSDQWVQLVSATLDCKSRREIGENTYFAGRGSGGTTVIVSYSGLVACDRAASELRGVISALHPRLAKTLAAHGLVLSPGPLLMLRTDDGPGVTLLGIGLLLLGVAAGAFLWREGLKTRRAARL